MSDQVATSIVRDAYDAIKLASLPEDLRRQVSSLVERVASSDRVDEHGSWDFSAAFDKKGRGEALNWDLYAFGNDVHSGRLLLVVQVRQYRKVHKNWFPSVRKNYFLVGTNEDDSVFAHPISAGVVRSAINRRADVILAVQNWMFETTDYSKIIRQGDVALLPCKRPAPAPDVVSYERAANVEKSHLLTADEIRRNGDVYVKNPTLTHPIHPTITGKGWFKLVVSQRANYWKFAPPTID